MEDKIEKANFYVVGLVDHYSILRNQTCHWVEYIQIPL
jgi:hypothetical protein